MKKLSLLLALLFLVSCSQKSTNETNFSPVSDSQIIGGQDARAGDPRFRSTVGIIMVDDTSGDPIGVCTGTLIRSDIVLTAAHCVLSSDKKKLNFIVYFGDSLLDFSQLGSYRSATLAAAHEDYTDGTSKNAYDIALIKINGDIPQGYGPVAMLKNSDFLKDGTEFIAAGFGRSKRYSRSSKEDGTGQLRSVKLSITDLNFSETEFRSSSWSRGVCMGDSGGPAYVEVGGQFYLAGVSNRVLGIGSFNCIYTSIFLRVDKLQSWINQKLLEL